MKKYIRKKYFVYTLLPLMLAVILFIENPAKAVSYTFTTYNSGQQGFQSISYVSKTDTQYGEALETDDSDLNNVRYYMKWHFELPVTAYFLLSQSGKSYYNGYIGLAFSYSLAFAQGGTRQGYNIYWKDGIQDGVLTYIRTYNNGMVYCTILCRDFEVPQGDASNAATAQPLGYLCFDIIGKSSVSYESMTYTGGISVSSVDLNTTLTPDTSYWEQAFANGIDESSDIDTILQYLLVMGNRLSNMETDLHQFGIQTMTTVLGRLQAIVDNQSTMITNQGYILNWLSDIYGLLGNISGKLTTLIVLEGSQIDEMNELESMLESYWAMESSIAARQESEGAEAGSQVESAGDQLGSLSDELSMTMPDASEWFIGMSEIFDQNAVSQQTNIFKWTENGRILMYLTIVFTVAVIGYLLYGKRS